MSEFVFKILRHAEWQALRQHGTFPGSADDLRDGFIHLSTLEQVEGTLAKHFAGESDLLLLEIPVDGIREALRWESARAGALFPHLYADLTLTAVTRMFSIATTESGEHIIPSELIRRDSAGNGTG